MKHLKLTRFNLGGNNQDISSCNTQKLDHTLVTDVYVVLVGGRCGGGEGLGPKGLQHISEKGGKFMQEETAFPQTTLAFEGFLLSF